MMNMRATRFGLAAAFLLAAVALPLNAIVTAQNPSPIKVLLITGQSNQYHNWAVSSPIVKRQLEAGGRFVVTVATTPPNSARPPL